MTSVATHVWRTCVSHTYAYAYAYVYVYAYASLKFRVESTASCMQRDDELAEVASCIGTAHLTLMAMFQEHLRMHTSNEVHN